MNNFDEFKPTGRTVTALEMVFYCALFASFPLFVIMSDFLDRM